MAGNTFKFSFNFSPPPPSSSECNNTNHASNKTARGINNISSITSFGNTDNDKLISTTTKPLEIINLSESLSRLKAYPKDQNHDEVHLSQDNCRIDPLKRIKFTGSCDNIPKLSDTLNTVTESTVESPVKNHVIDEKELIENQKTDIIPGVYEGGLKLWESSVDLCIHLAEELSRLREEGLDAEVNTNDFKESDHPHNDIRHAILSKGGSTWELGCGHGLPGCLILRELFKRQQLYNSTDNDGKIAYSEGRKERGIKVGTGNEPKVLFSDYNDFVLRDVTLPNIVLNTRFTSGCESEISDELNDETEGLLNRLTCLAAGDWLKLSELLSASKDQTIHSKVDEFGQISKFPIDGRFDLILGAEVTYSIPSTKDTVILLLRHLKLNTGIGLVATKRYYFGVGGGTDVFREIAIREVICVDDITYGLSIEKIKSYDSGKGNIRDLLRIRCVQR